MLIRFEVENFKSIREPAELSMVAIDNRPETRERPGLSVSLLPVAGIFGANASGKTNMLEALLWLQKAVHDSLTRWDDEIPVQAFAFGDGPSRDTSFSLELDVEGVRYEYLLDLNRERVAYEALYHYPKGRRRMLFERDDDTLALQRGFGGLSGARSLLTKRSLVLTILRRFDEPVIDSFIERVGGIVALGVRRISGLSRYSYGPKSSNDVFDADTSAQATQGASDAQVSGDSLDSRSRALALLRLADFGVSDVEVTNRQETNGRDLVTYKDKRLIHDGAGERIAFEFGDESAGTKSWYELIGPLLTALERGSIAVFDELDASLHPTLTAQVVRLFADPGSNPRDAQLIFTTHDTNLLNHLNRDEVWLTQKDSAGATAFGALAEFAGKQVRESANLEKGYLGGRFGALPDVSQPHVLRELGLLV
ncbi:AAA family ATPase [Micrococcales bacterium 31B]|nr:AAA family ATPase [Micrococcales bacterium 31B]